MKQLYCPHRITISGIQQYCNNGKPSMDCEHCDCPDKKEFDVTITTSSSEILSNKMKRREERAYYYASKKNPSIFTVGEIAKHYDDGYVDGQKDTIEKACEWLKFNYVEFTDNSELGLNINELIKDFKKDFRKAMEE